MMTAEKQDNDDQNNVTSAADAALGGAANMPPDVAEKVVNIKKEQSDSQQATNGQPHIETGAPSPSIGANKQPEQERKFKLSKLWSIDGFAENKGKLTAAIIIGVVGIGLAIPDVRDNVWGHFAKQVMPSLNQGEVKDPLWQIRLNEMDDRYLQVIQATNDRVQSLRSGYDVAQAAKETAEVAKISIQNLNTNVLHLTAQLQDIHARMDGFDEEILSLIEAQAYVGDLDPLTKSVENLEAKITQVNNNAQQTADSLAENLERIAAVEKVTAALVVANSPKAKEADVELKAEPKPPVVSRELREKNGWVLSGISSRGSLAVMRNTVTNQQMRVVNGTNIPRCGKVTQISRKDDMVITEFCQIPRGVNRG